MPVFEHVKRRYRRTWLFVTFAAWSIGAWGLPLLARECFPVLVSIHWSAFFFAPRLGHAVARRLVTPEARDAGRWVLCGSPPGWAFTPWGWYAPWLALTLLLPVLSYAGYLALPIILVSWVVHAVLWVAECLKRARVVAILRGELVAYRSQAWTLEDERGVRSIDLTRVDAERSEISLRQGPSAALETWRVVGEMGALTESSRHLLDGS
jgi:hypothetical protein